MVMWVKNYIILVDIMETSNDPGPLSSCEELVFVEDEERYFRGYVVLVAIYNGPREGYVIKHVTIEEYVVEDPCTYEEYRYTGEFKKTTIYRSVIPYEELAEMFAYDSPDILHRRNELFEISAEELLADNELCDILEKVNVSSSCTFSDMKLIDIINTEEVDITTIEDPDNYVMDWLAGYDCNIVVVRDGKIENHSNICYKRDEEKAEILKALGRELFSGREAGS